MIDKNLEIGKTFKVQNKILKVEFGFFCEGCFFSKKNCYDKEVKNNIPECVGYCREDRKPVIFVEVKNEKN